uniref:THO complex 1 n=1 Tax=Oryzias melastigma TaxID=30732 RepID=A0A3B3BNC1_ORYME
VKMSPSLFNFVDVKDKFTVRVYKICLNSLVRICSATTPFVLLGDVLDCLPLDLCDKIFSFVEENVSTWKSVNKIPLKMFNICISIVYTNEKEEGMEEGEMGEEEAPAQSSIPIDYNLYRKFWTLQDYFRNPVQCYDKFLWMTFLKFSDETLAVFKSYKLDDMQASKRKLDELRGSDGEHVYFAKFLTSEKLMDLQLSDSNFRRHILLQYLILFQYLKGQVKFKRSVDDKPKRPSRKRQAPEDFLGKGPDRKIFMGNMQVRREFMPSLDEFFAEAIEQADPVNMVEEEYKVVRNPNYGWRALRLLSRRSPHFFQPTNQKFKSLADYLDSMVSKLAKELPDIPSEEIKTGEEDDDDNGDNLLKDNNDSPSIQSKLVTNQQMDDIAAKLGAQWKSLASHLEMKAAELREIETDSEDVEMQAKLLLVAWQDREGTQATVESLVTALNAAGFSQIADSLSEA